MRGAHDRFAGQATHVGSAPPSLWRQANVVLTPSTFLWTSAAPQPILPPIVCLVSGQFSRRPLLPPLPHDSRLPLPPLHRPRSESSRGSSCPEPRLPGNAAYLTPVAMVTAPYAPSPLGGRNGGPFAEGPRDPNGVWATPHLLAQAALPSVF